MAQGAATAPQAPAPVPVHAAPNRPERVYSPRHTYGALDLGTNNCRLLIARPADEGFVVVDAFSRVVRLGEGLARSGRLSDAAMDRALSALSVCADKLRRRSAPWGVVSLTESEGRDHHGAEEHLAAYVRMRERARHAFRRFAEQLPADKQDLRLMGTSGTVTTLASVHLALPSYDRRAIDGGRSAA
jgi:exopolyphosphatase/guanosine-5'-triphosphate,3'-diphosphate pyrophosphatase